MTRHSSANDDEIGDICVELRVWIREFKTPKKNLHNTTAWEGEEVEFKTQSAITRVFLTSESRNESAVPCRPTRTTIRNLDFIAHSLGRWNSRISGLFSTLLRPENYTRMKWTNLVLWLLMTATHKKWIEIERKRKKKLLEKVVKFVGGLTALFKISLFFLRFNNFSQRDWEWRAASETT